MKDKTACKKKDKMMIKAVVQKELENINKNWKI